VRGVRAPALRLIRVQSRDSASVVFSGPYGKIFTHLLEPDKCSRTSKLRPVTARNVLHFNYLMLKAGLVICPKVVQIAPQSSHQDF
jgi:hypothetical protein